MRRVKKIERERDREVERGVCGRSICLFVYLGGNGIAVVCVRVYTNEDIEAAADSKQRW